jgi:type IV pilus assembly protein PilN
MIKINLLPFRAARKKENIKRQISFYILSVLLLFSVMGYYFLNLNSQLSALKTEQAEKKKELASYAGTNEKLKKLKDQITEIRTKLEVIRGLEKSKSGPVRLLDEIAMAVPKEKLWLTALQEKQGKLTLQGTAMDNETVALFMTNLQSAEQIVSVELRSAKLKHLAAFKLDVVDFDLNCTTYSYKAPAKPGTKKAGKKPKKR